MSWWTDHVVPRLVDRSCGTTVFAELRSEICTGLHGRVLELGAGSGHNLAHLPNDVTELLAVEPSDLAWRRTESRIATETIPVSRVGLDGQSIDLPDASVDAVLITFALCTIPDPSAALAEASRVLRPGGRLQMLEHGLAPQPGVARWQRRWEPLYRPIAGGCHLTRDPIQLAENAGFTIDTFHGGYLPDTPKVARPWAYLHRGILVR